MPFLIFRDNELDGTWSFRKTVSFSCPNSTLFWSCFLDSVHCMFLRSGVMFESSNDKPMPVYEMDWQFRRDKKGGILYLYLNFLTKLRYDERSDVWSLGCIFLEMATCGFMDVSMQYTYKDTPREGDRERGWCTPCTRNNFIFICYYFCFW